MKILPFPSGSLLNSPLSSSSTNAYPSTPPEPIGDMDDVDWPVVSLDEGRQQLRELGGLEVFIQDPTLPTVHFTLTPERLKKSEVNAKKDRKKRLIPFPKKFGPFSSATSWIRAMLRSGSSPRDFLQWGLQQGWKEGDHLKRYIRTWKPR